MGSSGRWALVAALAGFLFGFDTAVISGAEQAIQRVWAMSDAVHGLAISSALWGTVLGALLGGWPSDKWGRRPTLIGIGVLYAVSAVGSALAWDPFSFMLFRFIGGVGIGVSSVAAPAYISEIAPKAQRGRLVVLFQTMIVTGILIAFLSNWLLSGNSEEDWRLMLGVALRGDVEVQTLGIGELVVPLPGLGVLHLHLGQHRCPRISGSLPPAVPPDRCGSRRK